MGGGRVGRGGSSLAVMRGLNWLLSEKFSETHFSSSSSVKNKLVDIHDFSTVRN
jgi:hypothetical protein